MRSHLSTSLLGVTLGLLLLHCQTEPISPDANPSPPSSSTAGAPAATTTPDPTTPPSSTATTDPTSTATTQPTATATTEPTAQPTTQPTASATSTTSPTATTTTTATATTPPTSSSSAPAPTACPKGLPGPALVFVDHPKGNYCIDATEVTRAQYGQFVEAAAKSPPKQVAACDKNTSFVPEKPVMAGGGPTCAEQWEAWKKEDQELPVGCVDWCDAAAFCAWSGKHLCKGVGGAELHNPTGDHQTDNPLDSQWIYACTQGGKTKYPYGDTFQSGLCVDGLGEKPGYDKGGSACKGTAPPYTDLYNMTGNFVEWQDQCDPETMSCRLSSPVGHDCFFTGLQPMGAKADGLGFRCCYDAPATP